MRRRRRLEWFKDRLYGVLDEVIAGLIIVAILGAVSYIGWLATNVLPGLFANPALLATVGAVAVLLLAAVVTLIWRGRKRFVPRRRPTIEEERDVVLKRLFTGQTAPLETFRRLLDAKYPERRIVNIHGVGGVGKSWLLRMYRLICLEQEIPVALVSGDEERSVLDVLRSFSHQLEGQGVALTTFQDELEHYKRIQAKVQEKTTEWSALAKVAVEGGKVIPYVGGAIGALGAEGVEQLGRLLCNFLAREDVDLYLNPESALTEHFLEDLAEAAQRERMVLMLDTYEQMEGLDAWVRNWVGRLSGNLLVVIAGRAPFSLDWYDLRPLTEAIELREMDAADAKKCLEKYHQEYLKRPLNAPMAERLMQFGRGLPLALSSAVYLMAQYGAEEFAARQREIIADLVEVMTREAGEEWRPVLEVCAVVRWFTEDTLRALLGRDDVAALYSELRRFPFVRPRPSEGLALHDRVRDFLTEDLSQRSPHRYRELNEQAAQFFEERLGRIEQAGEKFSGEWRRLTVERLYHRLRADENEGVTLFGELFEEVDKSYQLKLCETLLEEIKGYSLQKENSKRWLKYWEGSLARSQNRWQKAERYFKELLDCSDLDNLLKSFVTFKLGLTLTPLGKRDEAEKYFKQSIEATEKFEDKASGELAKGRILCALGGVYRSLCEWGKALETIEESLSILQRYEDRPNVGWNYFYLEYVYRMQGDWDESARYCDKSLDIFEELDYEFGKGLVLQKLGNLHKARGEWERAIEYYKQSRDIMRSMGNEHHAGMTLGLLGDICRLQGQLDKAKHDIMHSLETMEKFEAEPYVAYILGFLGSIYQELKQYDEAIQMYEKSKELRGEVGVGDKYGEGWMFINLGDSYTSQGKWDEAYSAYIRGLEIMQELRAQYRVTTALCCLCHFCYVKGTPAEIPQYAREAERLAEEYGYWDQLARLRVVQGNLSADESSGLADNDARRGELLEDAFVKYSEAMTYALRYNRYLLDEVLEQIIAKCKERGVEGRAMLERLAEFWRTGKTEEGVALVEAERAGREREKGDGKPQVMVLERLQAEMGKSLEVR